MKALALVALWFFFGVGIRSVVHWVVDHTKAPRWLVLSLGIAFALGIHAIAHAAPAIPHQAQQHKALLIREARAAWGLPAPVATFAAQIHQESRWNERAVSPVGAQGMAQFLPATAKWLPQVAPETGQPLPFSPSWSIRALVAYDHWLWKRIPAATDCDRTAMMLAAYNGGLGWVQRDVQRARQLGVDQSLWWDEVEWVNAGRAPWAWTENRDYPRRILLIWEPIYRAAGWGLGACNVD